MVAREPPVTSAHVLAGAEGGPGVRRRGWRAFAAAQRAADPDSHPYGDILTPLCDSDHLPEEVVAEIRAEMLRATEGP